MTHDPFGGDDSFGAWLFEQSEIEGEKKLRKKTKPGENIEGSDGDGEANFSAFTFLTQNIEMRADHPQPFFHGGKPNSNMSWFAFG